MIKRPEGLKRMTLEFSRVTFTFFPFFKTVCLMDAWTGESVTMSWNHLEAMINEKRQSTNDQGAGI